MKIRFLITEILMILSYESAAAVSMIDGGWNYRLRLQLKDSQQSSLVINIHYYSRSVAMSELGLGWCGPWFGQVKKLSESEARLRLCGSDLEFRKTNSPQGENERWISHRGDELQWVGASSQVFLRSGHRLSFNGFGQMVSQEYRGQTDLILYDAMGRVTLWKRSDQTLLFGYQGLNRSARSLRLAAGSTVTFQQQQGHLKMVRDESGDYRFNYDEYSNLIEITNPQSFKTSIEYNTFEDRVEKVSHNDCNEKYSYKIDSIGQLASTRREAKCKGLDPISQEFITQQGAGE